MLYHEYIYAAKPMGVALDYYRATFWIGGNEQDYTGLQLIIRLREIAGETARGNNIKPWGLSGYKGLKLGSVCLGVRGDSAIVQLSGIGTQDCLSRLETDNHSVTRYDIALDMQLEQDCPRFAQHASFASEVALKTAPLKGRTPEPRLVVSPKGDTYYRGVRGGNYRMLRLYDKHRESKGRYPEGVWRYELETGGEYANEDFRRDYRGTVDDCRYYYKRLANYATRVGLPLPSPTGHNDTVWHKLVRPATDDDRSIAWLHKQVRGTVNRLVDKGKIDAIIDALDIH